LADAKNAGRKVGQLKWKAPKEYRSFTYSQSGFKLKNTSSRTRLWLSKLGDISLTFHRDLPDDIEIKTITVKQEPTGKWYAILGVETLTTRPQNWRIPSSASVSTWGFSSTPTIRTARQLSHSTSPTSVNDWNAHSVTLPETARV